ncbi:MAG TPA: hypothetical protein DEB31_09720, partial [Clostridiales bacterium]|nr:hypothetical protein [Clostridiales bacterium]
EDYWFSGEYDHASKLALLRNNKDVNVSWSVDNGVNLYNGTNVTAPAGARYSGEVTDDFVNWRIVDGNNASTDPWLRMTAADYSYTSVQLRGAANRIDRQSGRPIYYSQGKNGPLITVQAFANGAWTDVGQANAGELQYSNSNGGASSTNLGFDLPANTTRVRARYTNGEDYLYVRLDLTATLKASSPTLRTWLASNPANSGKRLRLQNFAYYNVTDQAGTNITPPPPSYSFSAIQGVNENLERDDIRDYGARVNRGTAAATLSDLAGGSNALKVAGAPVNDPANSRVNIPYALHGAEFYAGLDSGNLTELIATGWKPPARDEAVFYDLLPLGSFYNAALPTTAYDVHGNAAATVSVRTINDYKDSGRQMVVFTVKSNTPGQNYTKPFTSTYARPAVVADGTIAFVWPGAAPSFNTGYTVMFSASTPWDHVPYGRNGVNLASYQVAEENPLLGGGYVDNGDVAPHNAVKDPSGRNIFNDVRGNGVNAIRDTQYMSAPVSINVPVASASGLDKKVRSDAQGPLTPFKEEDTTRPNGDYTYQLRVGTVAGTRMRDVVLFDILEDTRNVDEHSTEQGWKGRFDDITLNYAEQTGIRPRVYYSTRTGLRYSTPPLTKASLSDTDTWSTTQPANKASITAIAVDLSTARNGQPFIFDSNTGTQVLVHMKAPATLPNVPNAYNKAAFYSVLIPAVGPETSSTVTGTHTQINMIDDPRFVKSSNPAGGTNATNATSLQPDQVVTYTLTYNPGIANAQGITVSDPVPAGMTFEPGSITFTAAGSTAPTPIPDSAYNAGTRTITWPTYNQATAGAATFTFRAKADALPSGAQGIDYRLYSNTGTVTRTNMPPQPPSNTITHEQRNRWADITKTAALVVDAPPTPANPTPTPTPTSPPLAQS